MSKEHIKDAQLNYCLVCASTQAIQNHGGEPLSCAMELPKPYASAQAEDSSNKEHRSTADPHSCWNPEDVYETLNYY
jgi:hypothetical protein